MARRFRGEETQTIDAKGRVSVPAAFRRVVQAGDPDYSDGKRPNMVIVYGPAQQKYLACYTIEAMDEIEARLDEMENTDERDELEFYFTGTAMDVQIVEDGRIVLPQKLRAKLDLTDRAYFVASGKHFKIWNPETYEATQSGKLDEWWAAQGERFNPERKLPDLPRKGADRPAVRLVRDKDTDQE